jgi:hypothetical protein
MKNAIYFDLDGTLVDLYNVTDWLPKLKAEDISPFVEAPPIFDNNTVDKILQELKAKNWKIGVISWLPLGATKKYEDRVRYAKKSWLKRNLTFAFDETHFLRYGTEKSKFAKIKKSWLVDDNLEVINNWKKMGGKGILVSNNLLNILSKLE